MKTLRLKAALAALAGATLLLAGCNEPALREQINALQEQLDDCRAERTRIEVELDDCLDDGDELRSRVLALKQQLEDCLSRQSDDLPPDWQGTKELAWINVGSDILFAAGRDELQASGQEKVAQVARDIAANFPEHEVWVIGHTDSDPIEASADRFKDNLDLSVNRACTVFRALAKVGVSPKRMIAAGQGEYRPVASNASDEGKAKNRRVQILAIAKPITQ